MEKLYLVAGENFGKVKDMLLKDDEINRQSITFRDAAHFELKKDGTYVKLSGDDAVLEKAKKLVGELWTEVAGKEKDDVLGEIKKEEDLATEGFGAIFE